MASELFNSHFGFRETPFALTPDPEFLYWSALHRKAYTVLEYGVVTGAPITVLTGEVGSGKTTLLRRLLGSITADLTVGLMSNAQADRGDLLRWVLAAFGLDAPDRADPVAMFHAFQDFVVREYSEGRRVLLIIDEAQNLGARRLEELRMLTNVNSGKDELLQLVLVGQPELKGLLRSPNLRQFAQRVSIFYHLKPLDHEGTTQYIQHRLRHVGGKGDEFSAAAVARIYSESHGVPRVTNKLCELSLVYAAMSDSPTVELEHVVEVLDDGLFIDTEPFVLGPDALSKAAE
ncbi:MAG: ATPase [Yangia sp.]|nr:ATPase [Salipiger sp.]